MPVGAARRVVVAQCDAFRKAPRGMEHSLGIVRNQETGETHVRQVDGAWKRADVPKPARRCRFAADAVREDFGRKRSPPERSAEERTAAARAARLPYRDD